MRKITLTLLLSFSMMVATGPKLVGEDLNSNIRSMQEKGYKIMTFSKDDAFGKYIKLAPHSIQIYFYTKKYCKEYNVPEELAFSIARLETNYRGPGMLHYKPNQTSYANALGTYQLLLSTAKYVVEVYSESFPGITSDDITPEVLLADVKLNTKIGIKYLRHLHNIYNSWIIASGFYNTGYPRINQYARDAVQYLDA